MRKLKFDLREGYDPSWIEPMIALYNRTELKRSNRSQVNAAFEKSFAVASAWRDERLLGIGRMISDGEMYSAIFDVVIDPDFQKQGLGKAIVENLISKAPQTCIHLTSTFGNEAFYLKLGFLKHKTAFALYPPPLRQSAYLDHDW